MTSGFVSGKAAKRLAATATMSRSLRTAFIESFSQVNAPPAPVSPCPLRTSYVGALVGAEILASLKTHATGQ